MAPRDDDFDVEVWNRRLAEAPAELPDRPVVGRSRRPSGEPADDGAEGFDPLDATLDPRTDTEAVAEQGFPAFAHGQWTVEGEIERFGAFGRGAARARGWQRTVALVLVGLLVLPLVLGLLELFSRLLS